MRTRLVGEILHIVGYLVLIGAFLWTGTFFMGILAPGSAQQKPASLECPTEMVFNNNDNDIPPYSSFSFISSDGRDVVRAILWIHRSRPQEPQTIIDFTTSGDKQGYRATFNGPRVFVERIDPNINGISHHAIYVRACPIATNTPTPTAHTATPTFTDTPNPTDTQTPEPTLTDTPTLVPTTAEPTSTATPIPTDVIEDTPTPTDKPDVTATFTPVPSSTDTDTPEPIPTDTPTPTEDSGIIEHPNITSTPENTPTPEITPNPGTPIPPDTPKKKIRTATPTSDVLPQTGLIDRDNPGGGILVSAAIITICLIAIGISRFLRRIT